MARVPRGNTQNSSHLFHFQRMRLCSLLIPIDCNPIYGAKDSQNDVLWYSPNWRISNYGNVCMTIGSFDGYGSVPIVTRDKARGVFACVK